MSSKKNYCKNCKWSVSFVTNTCEIVNKYTDVKTTELKNKLNADGNCKSYKEKK